MERLIEIYLDASYVALQAKHTDPTTWRQLYSLLMSLRERLSCQVCHSLVDHFNPHANGSACSECVFVLTTDDAPDIIIQCFKQLCALIHKSPMYVVMCARHEDSDLVKLLAEVTGVTQTTVGPYGQVNGKIVKQESNNSNYNLPFSVKLPIEKHKINDLSNSHVFDVCSLKNRSQNPSTVNVPKKKINERRWGCRCGNATTNPGKLTCFGQRCLCYTEQRPCDRCKCRGCRNPRQKQSDNDDNIKIDKIRRKPVTLELVSSLQPSHIVKSQPAFGSYTIHDVLQFSSHGQNYDQSGTEVTLGHVNSIFHSL